MTRAIRNAATALRADITTTGASPVGTYRLDPRGSLAVQVSTGGWAYVDFEVINGHAHIEPAVFCHLLPGGFHDTERKTL